MSNLKEIDRLIEAGLTLYGLGDLDGALLSWEQALGMDPDNAQAASYVDYVRQNYDLLTNAVTTDYDERGAPFGIADDDPEYQIEVLPGEELGPGPSASQPLYIDPLDAGWDIEPEDLPRASQAHRPSRELDGIDPEPFEIQLDVPLDLGLPEGPGPRTLSADVPEVTVEIEADEPPAPQAPISFDDETREYPGGPPARRGQPTNVPAAGRPAITRAPTPKPAPKPEPDSEPELEIEISSFGTTPPPRASELSEFHNAPDPITTEFRPEKTPGFSTETPPGGFAQFTPTFDTPTSGFGTQVTDIRRRDTGFVQAVAPPSDDAPPNGAGDDDLGLGPAGNTVGPTEESVTVARPKRPSQVPPGLKMTLRTPGEPPEPEITIDPPPANASIELSYDDPSGGRVTVDPLADDLINSLPSPTPAPTPGKVTNTREMPPITRAPAKPTSEMKASSGTRDFPPQKTDKLPPEMRFALENVPTTETPTRDLTTSKLPTIAREITGAPTRDLGLRAAASALAGRTSEPPPPTDDEPTTLRKPSMINASTNADIILPFDPIDARSAQILDEVDVDVPKLESKEDRTRRRITRLFERSVEWNKTGELDKAVAAIDLALSEDPNSALAQKLIHRNRETMMTVFQAFLGDLERQPILARPLHELANAPISPRAAFLLSRIDGTLSLDEILDVSGMPRIEAYRYLCQLFLRNILR